MPHSQSAYSLLELLIALAILSLSGFALFDLLNTRLINFQQHQQINRQLQQQRALLAISAAINPTSMDNNSAFRRPEITGSLQWNWEATAIETQETHGDYSSGLYSVTLRPVSSLSAQTTGITLIKMGYQPNPSNP